MTTYSYDENYKPPAPVANIVVSANIAKRIGRGEDPSIAVKMLISTDADISSIPKYVIKELEKLGGYKLPYDMIVVEDFNGNKFQQKVYKLTLLPQPNGFGDARSLDFIEIDDDVGILGRDILNDYLICLDGRNLTWTIQR
jgi:hypothetical protein